MSSGKEATQTQKCGTPQCAGNESFLSLAGHELQGRARAAMAGEPLDHLSREEGDLRECGSSSPPPRWSLVTFLLFEFCCVFGPIELLIQMEPGERERGDREMAELLDRCLQDSSTLTICLRKTFHRSVDTREGGWA